ETGDKEKDLLRKQNAVAAGVKLLSDLRNLAEEADVILSAVPSSSSLSAAEGIVEHLSERHLFVDITAVTPAIKNEIWNRLKERGVRYVDAAVLGGLPKEKHKVPIAASGNGAEIF